VNPKPCLLTPFFSEYWEAVFLPHKERAKNAEEKGFQGTIGKGIW
jgi:hypothetical protein